MLGYINSLLKYGISDAEFMQAGIIRVWMNEWDVSIAEYNQCMNE